MSDWTANLGGIELSTPLIGASGTMGSLFEFDEVSDFGSYGAVVAKSVSYDPWSGRPAPRLAAAGPGMLNGIGIQNPGIKIWVDEYVPRFAEINSKVWGSVVGGSVDEFVSVATLMAAAGISALEVNLSCPNLDGHLFALDPKVSAEILSGICENVTIPVGAKLSPNSEDIVSVAAAVSEAGARWVTLTNTIWGAKLDLETRRPALSGNIGGYSGPPLKPIAMRCVIEVHQALPELAIVGCGGVRTADDVLEYTLAGASAVGIGTAHFENPRIATKVLKQLGRRLDQLGIKRLSELVGGAKLW